MISVIGRIGGWLYLWRAAIWSLLAASVLVFGATLLGSLSSDTYGLASLIGFVWATFLLAFAHLFARELPSVRPGDGWWTRLQLRALHALTWTLAVAVLALAVVLVWLTVRAVGVMGP